MTDFVSGLKSLSGSIVLAPEASDFLYEAAEEIERLRSALVQFVAACDTAPPTSMMIEIGMACTVARRVLAIPPADRQVTKNTEASQS
jgi:imidazolonepropionase-like amidohydrolase